MFLTTLIASRPTGIFALFGLFGRHAWTTRIYAAGRGEDVYTFSRLRFRSGPIQKYMYLSKNVMTSTMSHACFQVNFPAT